MSNEIFKRNRVPTSMLPQEGSTFEAMPQASSAILLILVCSLVSLTGSGCAPEPPQKEDTERRVPLALVESLTALRRYPENLSKVVKQVEQFFRVKDMSCCSTKIMSRPPFDDLHGTATILRLYDGQVQIGVLFLLAADAEVAECQRWVDEYKTKNATNSDGPDIHGALLIPLREHK